VWTGNSANKRGGAFHALASFSRCFATKSPLTRQQPPESIIQDPRPKQATANERQGKRAPIVPVTKVGRKRRSWSSKPRATIQSVQAPREHPIAAHVGGEPGWSSRSRFECGDPVYFFLTDAIGSRMTATLVSRGGIRSVQASNSSSLLSLELLIGRSSMASSKFETQITSPPLAA
jgi:hypothetical protein